MEVKVCSVKAEVFTSKKNGNLYARVVFDLDYCQKKYFVPLSDVAEMLGCSVAELVDNGEKTYNIAEVE